MAQQLRLQDVQFSPNGEHLVWCEGRGGRGVLVRWSPGGGECDVTTEQGVGGGVGYGGGEFALTKDAALFMAQGRLFRTGLEHGVAQALTPDFGAGAAPAPHPCGGVVMVHSYQGQDVLAWVPQGGERWPSVLVGGADFYMQPTWSPEGDRLAWVSWDQPNMPWDGGQLEVAKVEVDARGEAHVVGESQVWAGGEGEAVQQPLFSPKGDMLAYLSDRTGWMQIYLRELSTGRETQVSEGPGDYSTPAWIQGIRTIAWAPDGQSIWGIRTSEGRQTLVKHSVAEGGGGEECAWTKNYDTLAQITVSSQGHVALIAAAVATPPRVVMWDGTREWVVRRSGAERAPKEALAQAKSVSWEGEGGAEVFGNYFAPSSLECQGLPGELPPAIVMIHGGPTSQAMASWSTRNQFYATRGYAVLDVNYRGSTGYGRDYMQALRGQWGVVDVEDAVSAAQFLASQGLADPRRIAIMGGSAGGYTVLHALVRRPGVFAAGISMYGISNLFSLVEGTHKFEARYNDLLLGELPGAQEIWRARSPMFGITSLQDPVAIYQGAQDKVVPPEQAEQIVASLKARGIPHVYELYEGEGHGWRRPETIEAFYDSTLAFLKQHVLMPQGRGQASNA